MMPVLIVVALLALTIVFIYNGLVRLRVQCNNAWADIDVQLKRRYDLIPNLVETVKGYAAHEKGTFDAVVSARNQAMSAQGPVNLIEDTLQNARRYYNAVVRDLNTRIEQFPSNLVASMCGFKPREFFEITAPAEREVPRVSFGVTPS
jgi:LemA protein